MDLISFYVIWHYLECFSGNLMGFLPSFNYISFFFSSNGMQLWFPEIVNRSSGAENNSSTVCEILSVPVEQPNVTETLVNIFNF